MGSMHSGHMQPAGYGAGIGLYPKFFIHKAEIITTLPTEGTFGYEFSELAQNQGRREAWQMVATVIFNTGQRVLTP